MKMPSKATNMEFLFISDKIKEIVRPVTALDIYDGATNNFHPNGLYSTEIFGVVGTPQRMEKFSWIDLKLEVFHPMVFFALMKLKGFYSEIISGKQFAVFDEASKDFQKVEPDQGETGFYFFLKHWKKIVHQKTTSDKRDEFIKLVTDRKDKCMLSSAYVLPAGYRDITIDENGRESSDELNKLYYKLIAICNTIQPSVASGAPDMFNAQRLSIQNAINEIYLSRIQIIKGKNGRFMGMWMARNVAGSTRNVLTAMSFSSNHLNSPAEININEAGVGIYQYVNATQTESIFQIRNGFLSKVFVAPGAPALLVNKKTMKSERVQISAKVFDRWMTSDGLKKVMATYEEPSLRWKPIEIEGYYLGLIYRGADNDFKLINGIDELPEGRKAEDCLPITLTELFYISTYFESQKYVAFVTRYPVGSNRSTYPCHPALISTVKKEVRTPLDDTWRKDSPEKVARFFPVRDSDTFNSLAPHPCRHDKLNADHDGDTGSFIVNTSRESIEEGRRVMDSKEFYLDVDGSFVANFSTDTVKYVNRALTGGQ